jgi:biopolymer transport protein ExbB/TolQ
VNTLYGSATQVFYQIANAFFWPVAIALLVLFALSLVDLGALLVQWARKRRESPTDLSAVAMAIAMDLRRARSGHDVLANVEMSPSLARFWTRVQARLRAVPSTENLDVWLEETLQQEEIDIASRLDRSRALVRLGPMLGLAGTIIPLGPALQALLTGDVAGMVDHLVIGFGAVVCGLMMSGIAYVITLVRERWSRVELKEMENLCELIVRALRPRHSREIDEEAPFESLSTA